MSLFSRFGLREPSRAEKARIIRGTIRNLDAAIQKHGPLPALLESLRIERTILDGFIDGVWDQDGIPYRGE